jgi:hypothetical protein
MPSKAYTGQREEGAERWWRSACFSAERVRRRPKTNNEPTAD